MEEEPSLFSSADAGDEVRSEPASVYPLLTDSMMAELRAQAAPGCVLCLIDEWEED
ncbi:MAG: hypothetical protein WB992_10185 [Bryobacteraceae bacterium]